MAKRRIDQIDIIEEFTLGNFENNYIIVDSDELNKTFRVRFSNFLDIIHGFLTPVGLSYQDGTAVMFSNGDCAEILRGTN